MAAIPALASLLLAGLALPAQADTGPAGPASVATPTAGSPIQAALLKARTTGRPVAVPSLETETSTVSAQPDGSLVQTTNALPVRVRRNGSWTAVSAALRANADGSLSPAATPSGVTLSGGGDSPLVTLTDPAGQSLSLTLPFALPTPSVSGNTATYADVLPGVDLRATVDDQGAFRDVLIVHNAAAAADPALKSLTLATSGTGLTVGTDAAGGLKATAANGTVAFSGPAPAMWDSSGAAATPAVPVQPSAKSAAVRTEAAPVSAALGGADTPAASSADGPGTGARFAPIAMHGGAGKLTLTPDADLLTGAHAAYPVFLDPTVVTDPTSHYVQAYSAPDCTTADTYDVAQSGGEGIGYVQPQWADGCDSGAEESFFAINLSGVPTNAVVSTATLNLTETFGADGGCGNTWPVTVKTVGSISSATNWNNRPGAATGTPAYNVTQQISSANSGSSCGNKSATFTGLANAVQYVAGGMLTIGLYGNESTSSTNYGHMRFSTNPYITTTYDIAPTVSGANTSPPAVTTAANGTQTPVGPACDSGTPGWIGMTSSSNGSAVTMNSVTTSPISGTTVETYFALRDNMLSDAGSPETVTYTHTAYQASKSPASAAVSVTLQDGHQYTWNTQGSDGTLSSNTIANCRFDVDLTPPTTATVTDPDFPPAGSGGTPDLHAGQTSTFTFNATDPVPNPATCTLAACLPASGVAGYYYSLDQPIGGASTVYVAAGSGGTATAPITPQTWGTHILYVQSMDNAGNRSTVPSSYTFYAPWNPDTAVKAGDLTGDGVPDLLATSSDGDLILLPGNTDPGSPAASQIAGTPGTSPDGTTAAPDGWNNFLIAHRGSLTNSGVDDLIAYSRTTGEMYMYSNDQGAGGTPGHFTITSDLHSIARPACTDPNRCSGYVQQPNAGNPSSWGSITQMVAPGDLAGNTSFAQGNLITMEGGRLWLYQNSGQSYLTDPILLGTGNWSNFTLVAPGAIGGNLNAATPTAGTPTLWARDNTTGTLYTFSLAKDANGNFPLLTPPTLTLTLPITASDGTHMCADDTHSDTTAGNPIQIWECNRTNAQSWTMHSNGTISTLGGNCLDLTASTPVNGTHAELEPCRTTGLGTQHWTATATGQLETDNGLCLADPSGDNTDTAIQLITWTCDNGTEQDWTGGVSALTGTSQAGQPFPPLTDPVSFGPNLPTASYPQLASPGDKTGLGEPDLFVTAPDGELTDYPGTAPVGGTATFGAPVLQGAYASASAWWELKDGSGTTATDSIGGTGGPNTATLQGTASWATDTTLTTGHPSLLPANPSSTVLSLDGTTGYAGTSGPVVATTGSYTVSAWVKLNDTSTYHTALCQRDATGARCAFYLQYSPALDGWTFVAPSNDSATPSAYYSAGQHQHPTVGAWTHLVAVFDSGTDAMSLYINGHLAGTGNDPSPWSATGPFLIGASDNASNGTEAEFPGEISDVHVYDSALSPAAATSIGDNPPPLTGLN